MAVKVAIIGGGILGAATAYYLSCLPGADHLRVTVFDSGHGQATKAAAGIISPWLSKRRNQQWYHLARAGAALLVRLARRTRMPRTVYDRSGAIMTRDTEPKIQALYELAVQRRRGAPTIGRIQKLTSRKVQRRLPLLSRSLPGVFISGGARVNGRRLVQFLLKLAKRRNLDVIHHSVKLMSSHQLLLGHHLKTFDCIVVATGAWLRKTLLPLHIKTDIRPQKGQLIVVQTPYRSPRHLPVLTPEGEYDFLPATDGQLVVGATHEDQKRFDLRPSRADSFRLLRAARYWVSGLKLSDVQQVRTGTRGYTSDYGPFFGPVPGYHHLLAGGGLGSSGLTTGPIMGKFLAELVLAHPEFAFIYYEKPIQKYFKSEG